MTADETYVISYDESCNKWVVNTGHEHYHQIQGLLHIMNKNGCWLVVWTPSETAVVFIEKDMSWPHWIKELEQFYFQILIPYIKQHFLNKHF